MKPNCYKTLCFSASLLAIGLQAIHAQEDAEVFDLNPFSVVEEEKGYMASTTISGTGMRTSLMNVPMSINVITSEFLEDSHIGDFSTVLDYNSSISQTARNNSSSARGSKYSLRGFTNRNLLVDGVLGGQRIPVQLIDRVEVVKGPNTLYGQSDPGGLVNVISKVPTAVDGGKVTFQVGNQGRAGGKFDLTTHAMNGKLGLRFLGDYSEYDGWRWVDGDTTKFFGVSGDYEFAEQTHGFFMMGKNETDGFPTQRATWSFERIPTDLNGDGDFDDSIPGGITEATARYNNTFIPREYVTSTAEHTYESDNDFLMLGLRHSFSDTHNLQYKYNFYDSHNFMNFREFNTFDAFGEANALNRIDDDRRRDEVHTINDIIGFETGGVRHQLLLGYRKSESTDGGDGTFNLRAVRPNENALMREIEAKTGKTFRDYLYKEDILNGVRIWEDDIISAEEMRTYGVRSNDADRSFQDIDTFYATDNIYFMEDRLNVLAGIRHIEISQRAISLGGAARGLPIDVSDTNFQLGGVYRINENLNVYVNFADSFEPNTGVNPDTGDFYTPQTSEAIELGIKFLDLFDGKLSGSATLFKIEKDSVVRSDYNPVTFVNDVSITADESKGFEIELFANPTENWNIVLGYSYIDAVVVGALNPLLEGLRLEGAAPQRLTFFNTYTIDEGPMEGLRFGGGLVWADGPIPQFGTPENALVFEDGYTVIDLFVRYPTMIGEQPVTFGINIDNVTDEFYVRSRAATNEARQILFSVAFDL